ncbi:MAG: Cof-type HAD-IIB family hydrolase [Blautia sp.]|nr:Cof-type HAD-IIB family hydrolase [Blautia sp.]MCM1202209.1 Cof-type HAD-IIB family hydrolase [Bacteroides fragilis]
MKILFTDLDGTLLNNQSMVSGNTKAFLDDFIHDGNKLVLSSGRPLMSILEVKELAGLDYPGILISASNGTQIYDCDSRIPILERRLPLSQVAYLQAQAKAFRLHIQTYTDDAIVTAAEDEEIRFYRRRIHLPLLLADDYASVLPKEPLKMLAIHLNDHNRLTAFCEHIADWAADRIQYIFSNDFYLELFHKDAGKGNAVRFICDYFQIPLADSYAAGDADNDISMIKAAGCGIAMKNAAPEVKEAADAITPKDNDNDGLAEFMRSAL